MNPKTIPLATLILGELMILGFALSLWTSIEPYSALSPEIGRTLNTGIIAGVLQATFILGVISRMIYNSEKTRLATEELVEIARAQTVAAAEQGKRPPGAAGGIWYQVK